MLTADLVRVDFALIPADPLFGAVVTASQVITGEFSYNANVIDARTFPPQPAHLHDPPGRLRRGHRRPGGTGGGRPARHRRAHGRALGQWLRDARRAAHSLAHGL